MTNGTRRGWGVSVTPRPLFTPGKETRYPLYRRLGGPQGRSGQVRKISTPTGIRSPDRPARSQSLYRLSNRGPQRIREECIKMYFEAVALEVWYWSYQAYDRENWRAFMVVVMKILVSYIVENFLTSLGTISFWGHECSSFWWKISLWVKQMTEFGRTAFGKRFNKCLQ